MLTLRIIVKVSHYKQLEFENAITGFVSKVITDSNNPSNDIKKDLTDGSIYYFEEVWKSKELLDKHFKSEIFQIILGAMMVLGEIISAEIITSEKEKTIDLGNLNILRSN